MCLLAGCETTGLSPRESSGVNYPNYILSLQSDSTNAPQPVVAPIRLAVAQVGEDAPSDAMMAKLAGQKTLVASVIGLPLPGQDVNYPTYNNRQNGPVEDYAGHIKALRGLARASGADYIFLVGGSINSWQTRNPSSLLDITLIGAMVAPGTEIKAEGKGAGTLIDVATGAPVFFTSTEVRDTKLSPDDLAYGKTDDLRSRVRDELVGKLTDDLLAKLAAVNSSASAQTHR